MLPEDLVHKNKFATKLRKIFLKYNTKELEWEENVEMRNVKYTERNILVISTAENSRGEVYQF